MIETGFDEICARAPWPAEAGEKADAAGDTPPTDGGENVGAEDKAKELYTKAAQSTKIRPETIRFQGMRMGYFCVDVESKDGKKVILNRIVSLKEDTGKD